MQYGGEDRELGERLINNGIKSLQIRYSTVAVHLEHSRDYVKEGMLEKNNAIRQKTRKEKRVWTNYGLVKSDKNKGE
jgi:hypothetical protein